MSFDGLAEDRRAELRADAVVRDPLTRIGMWSPLILAWAFQFAAHVPLARPP